MAGFDDKIICDHSNREKLAALLGPMHYRRERKRNITIIHTVYCNSK